jgi:hypothetical protein
VVALLPIHRLRASEHLLGLPSEQEPSAGIHRAVRGGGLD